MQGHGALNIALGVLVPVLRWEMGKNPLSLSTVVGLFDICLNNELPLSARHQTKPSFYNIRSFYAPTKKVIP